MTTPRTAALLLCAALSVSRAAAAQSAGAPAATPDATAARPAAAAPAKTDAALPAAGTAAPIRVRASHRVDVIAPGERVETVLDRMRTGAVPPGGDARPATDRPPVRGPDGQRPPGADRGPPDRPRGPDGTHPPAGTGSGPPPERPH